LKNSLASGRMLNKFCTALRVAGIPYTGNGYVVETQSQYDETVMQILKDVHNRQARQDAEERKRKKQFESHYNVEPTYPPGYKPFTGWCCPGGEIVECATYAHLDAVRELPGCPISQINEIWESTESVRESCQELSDREGSVNGEWHIYEMACDDAKHETWKCLLTHGFVRLGTRKQELCCEGIPSSLIKHNQRLRDFADERMMVAKMEPQKWNIPKPDPEYHI
jgi:hypothetical protein